MKAGLSNEAAQSSEGSTKTDLSAECFTGGYPSHGFIIYQVGSVLKSSKMYRDRCTTYPSASGGSAGRFYSIEVLTFSYVELGHPGMQQNIIYRSLSLYFHTQGRSVGGGGQGAMAPPKAISRGAILSYGPPQSKTDEKCLTPTYPFGDIIRALWIFNRIFIEL